MTINRVCVPFPFSHARRARCLLIWFRPPLHLLLIHDWPWVTSTVVSRGSHAARMRCIDSSGWRRGQNFLSRNCSLSRKVIVSSNIVCHCTVLVGAAVDHSRRLGCRLCQVEGQQAAQSPKLLSLANIVRWSCVLYLYAINKCSSAHYTQLRITRTAIVNFFVISEDMFMELHWIYWFGKLCKDTFYQPIIKNFWRF